MAIKSEILLIFGIITIYLVLAQDIGFPEREEEDESKRNAQKRKPIYIPGRCDSNEYLYPGDQEDDWICDCIPGYLYHPSSDRCHAAYKIGPCQRNHYLIIANKKVIPECVPNPCEKDNHVMFKGKCYKLNAPGPCESPELSYVVGVNTTTLEISCIKLSVATRLGEDEDEEYILCPKGCKRFINEQTNQTQSMS